MRVKTLAVAVALLAGAFAAPATASTTVTRTFYVAPGGTDTADGSLQSPWRSIAKGLKSLRAGDTLYLRGGVYAQRVGGAGVGFVAVSPGTSTSRVKVAAYPGERPVIQGLLWVANMNYWTFDGVNVTWSDSNSDSEHMVRLRDGRGWVYENAEIWGAKSYANMNVLTSKAGLPTDWAIRRNCIHDNIGDATHGTAKDQLLYVNTGVPGGTGTIERNILFNAPRGKGVKLAGPTAGTGSSNVTVRYNTIHNTYKPAVVMGWATTGSAVHGNLLVKSDDTSLVRGYQLDGAGNWAKDNAGFANARVLSSDSGYASTVEDRAGNRLVDPKFDSIGCSGFHPTNPDAVPYGRYAPAV
jgi:hypothetical protein